MEKAVKIGGKDLVLRGLTWGEKKKLKEQGYNVSVINPYADNDDMIEAIIKVVCGEDLTFLEDMDSIEAYKIFKEIHGMTFLSGDESKN